MNEHIFLGKMNRLRIDRDTEPGLYLICEDEEVVLLPNAYVTDDMEVGDEIDVFVYTDSEDRLVATTLTPKGMVDEYVALKVVDTMKYGAFMDWGLPKDLLVPQKYQKTIYHKGQTKVIRIVEDLDTDRLYGTEKFSEFLSKDIKLLEKNQEVNLMVFHKTPLGYKVLIANNYEGMIFDNEIFQPIEIGDKLVGYIKDIRKDGKIDVSLQPIGKKASKGVGSSKILEVLKANDGKIGFTYKSDADDINETFGMSKKAFKKALTELKDGGIIEINETNMELKKK
ncbi:MAG: DNA-binding protein [Arcobacteraceae bacterium]|nr:DNA-binding protein [Arcobacteraceae bacterium]